jgi:hypothetical protein
VIHEQTCDLVSLDHGALFDRQTSGKGVFLM